MIRAGLNRSFTVALILFALLPTGIASAQKASFTDADVAQHVAEPPATIQHQTEEAPRQNVILPPAPNIIRRSSNVIAIPITGVSPEPKFEERQAAGPGVRIGSVFGYRRDPFTRRARFHSGLDIQARRGDPVGASYTGTVQFAGRHSGYGNLIIVDHGNGITTYYAHLSAFEVKVGEKVERGSLLGYAGSTGRSTSPHLHYEVRVSGNPVNPLQPIAINPATSPSQPTAPERK